MLMRHRVHEWFADRFAWVQYPDIRGTAQRRADARRPLSGPMRVGLGLIGSFGILFSGALLLIAGFVIWALLAA